MNFGRPGADASTGAFPSDFLWGVATSAYQIEGSPLADGAGPSIWHRFCRVPEMTVGTGDVACDHYRRYREDVAIMADLGVQAYRFSLAWSRILPEGTGPVNPRGLDFYERLVDALLKKNIQPCITLYHWDLPAALADRGGWLEPDAARWFADYARVAFRRLGDRVPLWMTINEPWVVCDAGYLHGVHAPGHSSSKDSALAAKHLMLAHAEAVRAYRCEAQGQIGLVVNLEPKTPATESPEDAAAAARDDAYFNRQFLDPVLLGETPPELPEMFGEAWPTYAAKDLESIREPIDFVGINYYKRAVVRHDDAVPLIRAREVPQPQHRTTELGWEVHPPSLFRILCWMKERYGDVPLYVTENGAAFDDPPRPLSDPVDDPLRVQYLREHLRAARRAIARGVNLRGYFAWSLLDNFEWTFGTTMRFGLVHVDFETQRRTLKQSAVFYRDVVRKNGA